MDTLVTGIHITVAIFLILVVLLQAGKGANIGASFGGSSQTVFGSRGSSSFLSKLTTLAAAGFMVTSLILSMLSSSGSSSSVMDDKTSKPKAVETAPAEPKKKVAPSEEGGFDPFKSTTGKDKK